MGGGHGTLKNAAVPFRLRVARRRSRLLPRAGSRVIREDAIPPRGGVLSRSRAKMIKAGWKAAARRSFPLRIAPEGDVDVCDNDDDDDDSKTKPPEWPRDRSLICSLPAASSPRRRVSKSPRESGRL